MTNREFNEKYDEEVRALAIAQEVDMGTGSDMLKYELRVKAGIVDRVDTYKGIPDDFNWEQATEDLDSITD